MNDKTDMKPMLSIDFFDFLFKEDEMTKRKFIFSGIWRPIKTLKNAKAPHCCEAFFQLAERTGLEPATPAVTGQYSNQLNYRSVSLSRLQK